MTRYSGRVVKKRVARGSKSERQAVVLVTDGGDLLLRRVGGNAFKDEVLEDLVGSTIVCEGSMRGRHLMLHSWKIIGED